MHRKISASIVFDDQKHSITEFDAKHPILLRGLKAFHPSDPTPVPFRLSEKECLDIIGALVWGMQAMRKRGKVKTQ